MINMDRTSQGLGKGFISHRHTGREVSIPDLDGVDMSDAILLGLAQEDVLKPPTLLQRITALKASSFPFLACINAKATPNLDLAQHVDIPSSPASANRCAQRAEIGGYS